MMTSDVPLPLADIRALEERAFNAWPALETLLMDGWLLRFSRGFTKRANSVNAWLPQIQAAGIATRADPLFQDASLPLTFRLSPLANPEDDQWLSQQGFHRLDETLVMVAPIGSVDCDAALVVASRPDETWTSGFAAANRVPDAHRRTHDLMLSRIRMPAAFAALEIGGRPGAFGLAVLERGMVGLFDIVTAPDVRRQGIARRLVSSLLAWGRLQGATRAYLQVVASNVPAIALYRQLGFTEAYRYHYRVAAHSP